MDWKAIKAEYIAGGISYRKLAEKHGVSFNTLKTHAIEEQWHKLRKQKDQKATTKMVETISTIDAKKAVTINNVADRLLEKVMELLEAAPLDTPSLKHLTSALKDIKDIKGFKSAADMKEQEARIAKLMKEAEATKDDTNKSVVVRIEGGVDQAWLK